MIDIESANALNVADNSTMHDHSVILIKHAIDAQNIILLTVK